MKRSPILAIAVLALLVGACGVWMVVANRHCITAEGYEKIQDGMTQKQVESILDGPPGDYGPESVAGPTSGVLVPLFPDRAETWVAGFVGITVHFDGAGRVIHKRLSGRAVGEDTWSDKICRWLRIR